MKQKKNGIIKHELYDMAERSNVTAKLSWVMVKEELLILLLQLCLSISNNKIIYCLYFLYPCGELLIFFNG